MKPTLKSKIEELLERKEKQFEKVLFDYGILKEDQEKERKKSNQCLTVEIINIDKKIDRNFTSRHELTHFITDLKLLLNWA